MELILAIALAIFAIWLVRRMARRASPRQVPAVSAPIEVRISTETSTPEVKQGPLTPAGSNRWLLNPLSPLPITVEGISQDTATQLKALLERAEYWSQKIPDIAYIIASTNARFKEVDDFVSECKPLFDAKIENAKATSVDWKDGSERERQALMDEFRQQAKEQMPVYIEDIDDVLAGRPANFEMDDALLKRFAGDANLYHVEPIAKLVG